MDSPHKVRAQVSNELRVWPVRGQENGPDSVDVGRVLSCDRGVRRSKETVNTCQKPFTVGNEHLADFLTEDRRDSETIVAGEAQSAVQDVENLWLDGHCGITSEKC